MEGKKRDRLTEQKGNRKGKHIHTHTHTHTHGGERGRVEWTRYKQTIRQAAKKEKKERTKRNPPTTEVPTLIPIPTLATSTTVSPCSQTVDGNKWNFISGPYFCGSRRPMCNPDILISVRDAPHPWLLLLAFAFLTHLLRCVLNGIWMKVSAGVDYIQSLSSRRKRPL